MARKWVTLAVVNVAVFMLLLDITVVNTALPSIGVAKELQQSTAIVNTPWPAMCPFCAYPM